MKSLLFSTLMNNKGILFFAFSVAPFFDWLRRILNLDYMPVRLLGILTIFIFVDMLLGLLAAYKTKEEITSKKGFRAVWRIVFYTLFLYATSQLVVITGGESPFLEGVVEYVKLFTYTLGLLWEIHSWGENYKRAYGYKPRFFTFMDTIAKAFEMLIINKIKDSDIKNNK